MKNLGAQIRAARGRRGWTQAQLAERVGRSQATISLIERGQVAPPQVVEQILSLFGDELRQEEDNLDKRPSPPAILTVPRLSVQKSELPLPLRLEEWKREETGGDFFFLLPLPRESVLLVAVDVAGHGSSAYPRALYLGGWLRGWVKGLSTPPRLETLAQDLRGELLSSGVEAGFYLALLSRQELPAHTVSYEALAQGFPPPLLLVGPPFRTLESTPTNGSPGRLQHHTLQAPWRLLLTSDGLLKRLGAGSEREGLRALLRWQRGPDRDEPPLLHLKTEAPLSDDESLLLVEWSAWDMEESIAVEEDVERHRLLRVITERARRVVGEAQARALLQAVVEALDNVRRHAYQGRGQVTLRFREEGARCRVEVEDNGAGMQAKEDEAEERGFAIMRRKVALVEVRRAYPRGTILTLVQEKKT